MNYSAPDLRAAPPRSPRIQLGGFVILPRILDKCRASLHKTNGEYNYACPLDQRFLSFVGIDPEALKAEVAKGLGDGDLLQWILDHSPANLSEVDIASWTRLQEQRVPPGVEMREFFNAVHKQAAPHREDIATWFDLLDLDDYVSFGGKA